MASLSKGLAFASVSNNPRACQALVDRIPPLLRPLCLDMSACKNGSLTRFVQDLEVFIQSIIDNDSPKVEQLEKLSKVRWLLQWVNLCLYDGSFNVSSLCRSDLGRHWKIKRRNCRLLMSGFCKLMIHLPSSSAILPSRISFLPWPPKSRTFRWFSKLLWRIAVSMKKISANFNVSRWEKTM